MTQWHETSIIHQKSPDPESIKEKIRCGAFGNKTGVSIGIRWNQRCHSEYPSQCQIGIRDLAPQFARELAAAILKAADDAEEK